MLIVSLKRFVKRKNVVNIVDGDYMNYKEAEKLAQRLSLENPEERFYVNLLDNNMEYCVDDKPDMDNQYYYLNGELYCDMEDGYDYDD